MIMKGCVGHFHMYKLPSLCREYQSERRHIFRTSGSFYVPHSICSLVPPMTNPCIKLLNSLSLIQSLCKIQPQKYPLILLHPLCIWVCFCQSRKRRIVSAKPQNWPIDRNLDTKSANIMHILVTFHSISKYFACVFDDDLGVKIVDQKCLLLNVVT